MTPEQKIKHAIINKVAIWNDQPPPVVTTENVDQIYEALKSEDGHYDAMYEIRGGDVETGLPCYLGRSYESKSVAAIMPDGTWVGWTYWYGGGKCGEPEAVEWMADAYDLECVEEEKLVTVRTFTKCES